ncbi:hypothetical protein [Roseitalea sp. MMSF_3504]|uniref:hypothetical protein n=1 Tax=Roseitalea sp. MMSF_3504 TaxID=3046716 RepID=UPI00273D518E|nr:hypothetical protein [Roseitalea sp. MMSF_3504]
MAAAALLAGAATAGMPAIAAEEPASRELLLRKAVGFSQCPRAIEAMLSNIGASDRHVSVTADTAAHYRVKLVSIDANLVFLCNAVTEQITVTRTTPGELVSAAR